MPSLLRLADLLRAVLAVGALAALATGAPGADTALLVVAAAVALLARRALLPPPFDLTLVAALVVQAGGEALGLYDRLSWFDTLVHVTVPALTAPVAYLALARGEVLRDLRDPGPGLRAGGHLGIFVVTAALGLAVGAVWELFEAVSDGVAGSSLQESVGDTNRDLLADAAGALLGAAGLVAWAVRGPGSVARTRDGRPVIDA